MLKLVFILISIFHLPNIAKMESNSMVMKTAKFTTSFNRSEETLNVLENVLHQIYHHNVDTISFEDLYRSVYNMVLHGFGEKLYNGLISTISFHLVEIAKALEDTQDDSSFLQELHKKWMDHSKAMEVICVVYMYMDTTFIPSTHKSPVHQLGLTLWRDNVVESSELKARISSTLLEFIHRERIGTIIDMNLMKNITKMLVDLGPSVYQDVFEAPFLEVSAYFFKSESSKFGDQLSHAEYLKKVETMVEAEEERVLLYLDVITLAKITRVLKNEMFTERLKNEL